MELYIAAALKQPGETFQLSQEQEFAPQLFGGRNITFAAPVQLAGTYSFDGKTIVLEGWLEFCLFSHCASCNEAFNETLSFPIKERFVKGSLDEMAANEEESYAFDGEVLSLDTMVLDNFYLHLPIKSICKEDCRGLCPVCGANLNKAQCACVVEQEQEAPLATLAALLNDGKEV